MFYVVKKLTILSNCSEHGMRHVYDVVSCLELLLIADDSFQFMQ